MSMEEEAKTAQITCKSEIPAEGVSDFCVEKKESPKGSLSVASSTDDIIKEIDGASDPQTLKDLTNLFNLAMVKKEIARTSKQSELLDLVISQVADRLQKRPDELSNKELTDFMSAFQDSLDRSKNSASEIDSSRITAVDKHSEVNINIGGEKLDRDSRERVMDAVKSILSGIGEAQTADSRTQDVVDAECVDKAEDEVPKSQDPPSGLSNSADGVPTKEDDSQRKDKPQ